MTITETAATCPKCSSYHYTRRVCSKCGHIDAAKGTVCRVAHQCCSNGELGTFLYTGEPTTENIQDIDSRVSPLFNDFLELYEWIKERGIEEMGSRTYLFK